MATTGLQLNVGADVTGAVTGINQLNKSLKTLPQGANSASFALTNLGRVAQDAPFGFIGIQNNINPLLESFQRLKVETGSSSAALKALAGSFLGPAGLGVAVSLVTSAITFFVQAQQKAKSETKALTDETKSFADIQKDISESTAKEASRVELLVRLLQSETTSRQNKANSLKELQKLSPEYFAGLRLENGLVKDLSASYAEYVKNIALTIEAKTIEKQLEQINAKLLEGKTINQQGVEIGKVLANVYKQMAKEGGNNALSQKLAGEALKQNLQLTGQDFNLNFQKNALFARLLELYKLIKVEQVGGNDATKDGTDKAKEYEGAVKGVLSGYLANNAALAEQLKLQQELNNLQSKANELRKSGGLPNGLSNPNDQSNRSTAPTLFVPEDLALLAGVEEKLFSISDTINNGINAGIDQFFNALANNQDPFEALAQSAKRLVFELGAAVVKALILQTIANSLSGGTAGAGRAFANAASGLFKGTVRGADLRLLTFLSR